jgi:hypothetical protein
MIVAKGAKKSRGQSNIDGGKGAAFRSAVGRVSQSVEYGSRDRGKKMGGCGKRTFPWFVLLCRQYKT